MTIKEIKQEVKDINGWLKNNVSTKQWVAILKLQAKYINQKGYKREYIATNSRKPEIENHLECLIDACYVELGIEKFNECLLECRR